MVPIYQTIDTPKMLQPIEGGVEGGLRRQRAATAKKPI